MPNYKHNVQTKSKVVSVPFDADFYFDRGTRSVHRKDLAKAKKYFIKSVDLDPYNVKYLMNLAAVNTEIGDFEESNRYLFKIIHDLDRHQTECYYYLANNFAHLGDFDQAEHYALMYLRENRNGPYSEEAEELLDFICYELERAPREMDEEHQLIHQHEQAKLCLEEGRFIEASQQLEKMIKAYPHFLAARNNLALAYYYLGQFDQAIEVIEGILEKDQANLHALCNLAVFCRHKGEEKTVQVLVEGLKKVLPVQPDHHFKLATTLGILGEDQRAFELFSILMKSGLNRDVNLYHYLAVAAYNSGQYEKAASFWQKVKEIDPTGDIAPYYLQLIKNEQQHVSRSRISYHYQLPYDLHYKKDMLFSGGKIPKELMQEPLIRSSMFWSLRHGDQDTKLQVIQSFGYIADKEVEQALRQLIMDKKEQDYIKKVAIFVLRQIGATAPYQAWLHHKYVTIDADMNDEFPSWMAQWEKVMSCLRMGMEGEYDLLDHQEAQSIWSRFLRLSYPSLPKIRKPEGWAAAIEYLIALKNNKLYSKSEIARKYQITTATLRRNIESLEYVFCHH